MEPTAIILGVIGVLLSYIVLYAIIKGAVKAAIRETRTDKPVDPTNSGPTEAEKKFFGN